MDQSFTDRMESLHQEVYSSKQQINILNATVGHLREENSDLQHELTMLQEKAKEDKVRLQSTSDVCQLSEDKLSDLSEQLQLAIDEKEAAQKEVKELKESLASVESKPETEQNQSALSVCECQSETSQLQMDYLKQELESQKGHMSEMVGKLQTALESNINMKSELEELNVELECLQSQVTSQCNIIQYQKEELDELRGEAEASLACVDSNRKGNSLFSEVEDRRVLAETKVVKVMDKVSRLEDRVNKEKKENKRLKNQVTLLMRSASKVDEKSISNLEKELEESKKQVLSLTEKLTQQSQTGKQAWIDPALLQRHSNDTALTTFYKSTIANLQKEKEVLQKEKNHLEVQVIQLDFMWTQKKNEVRRLTSEKDRLTSLNAHQQMVIDSLKESSPEPARTSQPKEMVKINFTDSTWEDSTGQNSQPADAVLNDGSDKQNTEVEKENKTDVWSMLFDGSSSKSVRFAEEVDDKEMKNVLSEIDNSLRTGTSCDDGSDEKVGGSKKKLSRKEGGSGKYRSVNTVVLEDVMPEDEPPECHQQ